MPPLQEHLCSAEWGFLALFPPTHFHGALIENQDNLLQLGLSMCALPALPGSARRGEGTGLSHLCAQHGTQLSGVHARGGWETVCLSH